VIVAALAGTPASVRADLTALAIRRASIPAEVAAEVRLDLMDPPDPSVFAGAPLPLVATCRRPRDGGRFRGGEGDRLDLLRRAAAAGARWVDVEADALGAWTPAGAARLVASLHDYEATPPDLPARVRQLLSAGAAIVKVATRTRALLDMVALAAAVRQAPGRVTAVGFGASGAASRILSDRLGSAWTYTRFSAAGGAGPRELEDAGVPELGELVDFFRGGRFDRDVPAFAVVGDRADESIGPRAFNRLFREKRVAATYVHLKTPSLAGLREVCRLLNVRGVSVTTPFKDAALVAADRIDDSAAPIGAANTLSLADGEWVASNTDRSGLSAPVRANLEARGIDPAGLSALVAGAGGMGRAAAIALRELGCKVSMTSRGQERLRRACETLAIRRVSAEEAASRPWDLLVNATPAGSARDPDARALDAAWAAPRGLVVETNYVPIDTPLVADARARGLSVITGDAVYAAQAAEQLRVFVPAIGHAAQAIREATTWALARNASS
jgi:3-dehydroquinate dehydratase/shikimate dehydrogenase